MGLNFLKKLKSNVSDSLVETNGNERRSRFIFAYDDSIEVMKYYLVPNDSILYTDLCEAAVFMCTKICYTLADGEKIYPIFKMPSKLPIEKLVTPKKVICIGSILVDKDASIQMLCDDFTGSSLEKIMYDLKLRSITAYEKVTIMLRDFVIDEKPIEGNIDLETFEKYITLKNTFELIMHDE